MRTRFVQSGNEWGCEILKDGRLYRCRAATKDEALANTLFLMGTKFQGIQQRPTTRWEDTPPHIRREAVERGMLPGSR